MLSISFHFSFLPLSFFNGLAMEEKSYYGFYVLWGD